MVNGFWQKYEGNSAEDNFSTNVEGIIGNHMQKYDLCSILAPCAKMNSEWIIDLNLKPRSIKLLGKKDRIMSLWPRVRQRFFFYLWHQKYGP